MRRLAGWACLAAGGLALLLSLRAPVPERVCELPVDLVWIDLERSPDSERALQRVRAAIQAEDRLREAASPLPAALESPAGSTPRALVYGTKGVEGFPRFGGALRLGVLPADSEPKRGFELLSVSLPEQARVGRPISLAALVASPARCKGKIRAWLGEEAAGEAEFDLDSREKEISLRAIPSEAGVRRVRVEAVEGLAPGRPKEIVGFVEVLPPPRVLVLGEPPPFAAAIEAQGFELLRAADPNDRPPDAVLVSGEVAEPESLSRFVRDGGGALFLAREAFARPFSSSLVEMLPLVPDLPVATKGSEPPPGTEPPETPPEAEGPPSGEPPRHEIRDPRKELKEAAVVALVLAIDKSGSMAGEKLQRAKEAALETAKTLHRDDLIGVVAFDREAVEISPLRPARAGAELGFELQKIEAGGGTRIYPAIERAVRMLESAPASIRHLIVLTDGATEDKVTAAAPYYDFVTAQASRGITFTMVGIRGGDYDAEFLSNLAFWGKGRFYPADAEKVPQVFTLEAKRVRGEGELPPRGESPDREETPPAPPPPREAPPASVRAVLRNPHPALAGFDFDAIASMPPLRGFLPSTPRLGSAVLLGIEETGDPLLAVRHWGSGRCGLWAGDGGEIWNAEWAGDPRAAKLLGQLFEYLRRREGERGAPVRLRVEAGSVEASLPSGGGPWMPSAFWKEILPGIPEKLEGIWSAADGAGWGSGRSSPEGRGLRSWSLGAEPEGKLRTREELRREAAAAAERLGGKLLESEEDLANFLAREKERVPEPRSPWLPAAAAALLAAGTFLQFRKDEAE